MIGNGKQHKKQTFTKYLNKYLPLVVPLNQSSFLSAPSSDVSNSLATHSVRIESYFRWEIFSVKYARING